MIFESVVVGELGVNCFILGCEKTKEGIVVDPGGEPGRILAAVSQLGLSVKYVINTHGHFDHVGGVKEVLAATGARYLVHREDVPFLSRASDSARAYGLRAENPPLPDEFMEDGLTVSFGECRLKVIHTPGHTPGGCCLYLEDENVVITGDTLFAESVGRTDLPGGSHEILVAGIRDRLLNLPEETSVWPGHGPASTIGHERRHNPYLH
ncbi:MBL fold metallo-hydrolase [Geobacter sp. DSM 9736]|uniref:MBL fold metallo-hydrolase n=1 Tax=Geobacter sp. DSM 9736 TaxID=1277350 RepID=UPI000B4FFE34|nr:MBL fold metallo-hydrolase [Geobacter sp. DSM 9736]SNB44894.1 Glyoxylase, beta-lactamase superfamily II [Geobacter sp. DSM 9736]